MYTKDQIEIAKKNGTAEKAYGDIVNSLIRRRYTLSDEMAILRQRDEKPEEYAAYNEYAEACKAEAKEFIASALAEGGVM